MKFSILFTVSLLISASGFAADCTTQQLLLQLNPENPVACQDFAPQGSFKMDTCSTGRGKISNESRTHYLFLNNNSWNARRETHDYTEKLTQIEVLKINSELTKFVFTRSIVLHDGTSSDSVSCEGEVKH